LNENGDKETMKTFTFKISNKKTTYDIGNQGLAFMLVLLKQSLPQFFSPTCPKAKEKSSIYSNKFFDNFHLSESSFTCHGLPASGLTRRLLPNSVRIRF
jgi:hypothetical protein